MRRSAPLILAALAILLAACVSDQRPEACDAEAVTIQITVTAEAMTPDDPGACRDQDVTLVISSETDGFLHIHGYDEEVPALEISAGEKVEVEFGADRSGQFPIELHPADDPEGIGIGIFTVYEP